MQNLLRADVTIYSPLFTPFRKPLEEELVSIGRASDCTIPIKDRYLSRRHAEIVSAEGAWVLKDLGSANGTYLNGSRVEQITMLRSGDRIRLGDTELVFESEEHQTDRHFAIASDTITRPTISISAHELEDPRPADPSAKDVSRLQTLNAMARELKDQQAVVRKHPGRAGLHFCAESIGARRRNSHRRLGRRGRFEQQAQLVELTNLIAIEQLGGAVSPERELVDEAV